MPDHTTNLSKHNTGDLNLEFIGVDWGSSSFRLMAFDSSGQIQYQITNSDGVAKLGKSELPGYLRALIETLMPGPAQVPVVMCGMVGSSLGWQEIPYLECPYTLPGLGNEAVRLDADFEAYVVPGLRCANSQLDVMRGEEVQVCGWWYTTQEQSAEPVRLCLPGTHSKWVTLKGDQIMNIETALTGELFAVTGSHSVLVQGQQQWREASFEQGVYAAQQGKGLLHNLFSVRANVVAGEDRGDAAESYLSGLLIGSELREQGLIELGQKELGPKKKGHQMSKSESAVHVIGNTELVERYAIAAKLLGIKMVCWSGEAMVAAGFKAIWRERHGQ